MRLQHSVFAAEVALAETAVADDALCGVFTFLEVAADSLGSAATERKGKVQRALAGDVAFKEWLGWGEVFAGEEKAEAGLGHVGAQRD